MTELDPRQKAAITKRRNTRDAFIGTASALFREFEYPDITVEDISRRSARSTPTFYNVFTGKSDWAAAVLDTRLNGSLDQQHNPEAGRTPIPRTKVLGYLAILGEVAAPLPGITKALVDERTNAGQGYSELLPTYYSEVYEALRDGQEQHAFRANMDAAEMANFALDSLAMAYAVHLDNPVAWTMNLPSLVLDGFLTR